MRRGWRWGIGLGVLSVLGLLGVARIAPADDAAPAFTRAALPGSIVYAGDQGGAWDIWLMKADGTAEQQLTKDAFVDSDPKFSPDGRKIIFTSLRNGIPQLRTMLRDGTGVEAICEGCQADWSPDARKIIFVRDNQIYIRELATKKERLATPPEWERCGFPAWCPDGKRFAVASRHENPIGVYLVAFDGKTPPVKVPTKTEACTPKWRKDGKTLLYQSSAHVFQTKDDGTGDQQLTFGGDIQHFAAYAPDESMIVYACGPNGEGPWQLFVMRLADEAVVSLTTAHSCMYPHWQLDPAPAGAQP